MSYKIKVSLNTIFLQVQLLKSEHVNNTMFPFTFNKHDKCTCISAKFSSNKPYLFTKSQTNKLEKELH